MEILIIEVVRNAKGEIMTTKHILDNYLKCSLKVKLLMYPYFILIVFVATIYDAILALRTTDTIQN